MPKRKRPEIKPEVQFKQFQKAAREIEADETGKTFEKAFSGLLCSKVKATNKATTRPKKQTP